MKLSITIGSLFLATLGIIGQVTGNSVVILTYSLLTCSSLLVVGVGGIVSYRNNADIRDIYREKDLIQKDKIQNLTEKLIGLEKELILRGKEENTQNIAINTSAWRQEN
jgi:hypothetical protein